MILLAACAPLGKQAPPVEGLDLGPRLLPVQSIKPALSVSSDELIRDGRIRFDHYPLEQGLSQSVAVCVLQDSMGFLWIGTEDGLSKFDGYSFTTYRHDSDDPFSLSNDNIHSLYEDRWGVLWIGTYGGGLNRYDRRTGEFTHYRHSPSDPNSLGGDQVMVVFGDSQDVLWIGLRGAGLNRFDPQTGIFHRFSSNPNDPNDPNSLSPGTVNAILEDSAGVLWIGTTGGLDRYDPERDQFVHLRTLPGDPNSLIDNRIRTLHEDSTSVLWVGTTDGLNALSPDRTRITRYQREPEDPYSLSDNQISAIHEDAIGNLWVGTYNGLNLYSHSTGRFAHYRHEPADASSLSENLISTIYEDQSGGIWVGTYGGGLDRFDPRSERFAHYQSEARSDNSLSHDEVWAIYEDSRGMLWIGTDGGGLNRYDRSQDRWDRFFNDPDDPDSLSNDDVMAIFEDSNGTLWFGTSGGGLEKFDRVSERFTHYRHNPASPSSLSNDTVWCIYEDRFGVLWIGTANGLNRFDPQTDSFIHYLHNPDNTYSLSDNAISAIFQDSAGFLWIGTHYGLNRLDPQTGRFTHYFHDPADPTSISYDIVFSFLEERSGMIWMGTWGGGLNRFDPQNEVFINYSVKDGMPNDVVYGILQDDHGNLWLSTNNGISRFDPQSGVFHNFHASDGLQSNEFSYNSYVKTSRGEMVFGGVNGFNIFHPDQVVENAYVPPVVLTALSIAGKPMDYSGAIETITDINLYWPDNSFSFEFSALNYYQPHKNQYAYYLEGYDDDWNYVDNHRFASYADLPGGEYTLRLKGSNNDGVWNEDGITIQVHITPPFWANSWFVGLMGILLGGVAYGLYRLRVRSVEARSYELGRLVEQRTREIERRRQELEALYSADEQLHRTLELDQVLKALMDTAIQILNADKGTLMVWNEEGKELIIRATHGFDQQTVNQVSIAPGQGVAGNVALSGQPAIVEDTHSDPRVTRRITDRENIRAFMQVPIKIGGQIFGVFSADYLEPRTFSENEQRLLVALAQRAALAIQNAQLYEQAQELAVVQERNRLARDLHDAVTQTLFSISLIAEVLPGVWVANPEDGRKQLEEIRLLARGALAEMRALLLELRPEELSRAKMVDLLKQLARVTTGHSGVLVEVKTDGDGVLAPLVQLTFYRVAQEALNNAGKHAKASKIEVYFSCYSDQATLVVQDDGCGFDMLDIPPGHFGLEIMRERAASINALFEITSRSGAGTVITLDWQALNAQDF